MRKIVTYGISFILMISILANIGLGILKNTILKKEYIEQKMEENNYYENVKENIQSGFESYIQQSGLPEEVIEELFTVEDIKQDTEIMLNNIYTSENTIIDTEKIKTKLREKIYDALADVRLMADDEKSIEEFIEIIGSTYQNEIEHSQWLGMFNGQIYKVNDKLNKVQIYIYVLPIILLGLIVICNIKNLGEVVKQVGISTLGASILIIIAVLIVRINVDIKNILILNEATSIVIRNTIYEILNNVTVISIGMGIVAIILCYLGNFVKINKK